MKRFFLALILFSASALFSIIAIEVGAQYLLSSKFGISRADANAVLRNKLNELPQTGEAFGTTNALQVNHERDLHPFFGYTGKRNSDGVNNLGFRTWQKFPYRKEKDEFVIATFGGSFAQQLIDDNEAVKTFNYLIFSAVKAKGYNKITHINLSESAWRQPQQHYAFMHYLKDIDLAITVDGFNEIVNIDNHLATNYPIEFPNSGIWLPLIKSTFDAERIKKMAKLFATYDSSARTGYWLDKSVAKVSMVPHLLWHIHHNRNLKEVGHIRKDMGEGVHWENYNTTPDSDEEKSRMIEDYFVSYENWITNAHTLAKAHGKNSFHFIQPNQYVKDSKEFSDEEKAHYLSNEKLGAAVAGNYHRLELMVEKLAHNGVDIYLLKNVFKDVKRTVYRDDCCHILPYGNQIVARAIAHKILESGVLGPARPHALGE